jgi:hypothetical protein
MIFLHLLVAHYQLVGVLIAWGMVMFLALGLNHAAHQSDHED